MKKISLCNGWQFTNNCTGSFINFKGEYPTIRLPHSPVELPLHHADEEQYQMVCGYRRKFEIPEEWSEKSIFLRFDGAAHAARVYINGEKVTEHHGGYTAFSIDLSRQSGTCYIAVELDSHESLNIPPFGNTIDYMTFSGLYRQAWILVAENSYIADCFVKTPEQGKILVDLSIKRPDGVDSVALYIRNSYGETICFTQIPKECITSEIKSFSCEVSDVQQWAPENPILYNLEVRLNDDAGKIQDVHTVRFGFRQAVFRAEGFYLNGEKYKIRGLNRHQSYPYVGYAMPASMQRYDAEILKNELHCNAVRTSHYPQSQAFLDACDELGLLVFTELPGWQHIGDEEWKEVACNNLQEMIIQSRNHPSIILWGVRINESQDDDPFYEKTNAIAQSLDPTRQTSGVRYIWKSHLLEDVYAFNDFSHAGANGGLLPKALISPEKNKGYLISEYNGHMFPTKSWDSPEQRLEHAKRHATVLDAIYGRDDIAGGFGWCMSDYYSHGDFGSGDRICYHGILDMFRNPKLAAGVYASCQDDVPVLVLGSDMHIGDYPAGSIGENYAFTNADSIQFYKNDTLRAVFPVNSRKWKNLPHPPVSIRDVIGDVIEKEVGWSHRKAEAVKDSLLAIQQYGVKIPITDILKTAWRALRWMVGPGRFINLYNRYCENWGISAPIFRYDAVKNGKVVASVTRQSNARLQLEVRTSHTNLFDGDSYDVAAVRIRLVDKNGATAIYTQLPVKLTILGQGELIGPDVVTAEGGMCGTYIKTNGMSGEILLTISAGQAGSKTLQFNVTCKENKQRLL